MSNRHGVLLMETQQHLGVLVPQVVHEAIVQPAKTRTRGQRDEWNGQLCEGVSDQVTAPGQCRFRLGLSQCQSPISYLLTFNYSNTPKLSHCQRGILPQ